jgi:hypothetical protein
MDAMRFIFNRNPIPQAGRRGFDPRLPLLDLEPSVFRRTSITSVSKRPATVTDELKHEDSRPSDLT